MNIQINITVGDRHRKENGDVNWTNDSHSELLVSFLANKEGAIEQTLRLVRKHLEEQLKTG